MSLMSFAAAGQAIVYKCVLPNGQIMFDDKQSKTAGVTCTALELPGYVAPPLINTGVIQSTQRKHVNALSSQEGKRIAAHDLRDPDTARFREVFVSKSGNVCGQMNAKNGYGAYTGYTDFFVLANSKRATIDGDQGTGAFRYEYRKACETAHSDVVSSEPQEPSTKPNASPSTPQDDRGRGAARGAFYSFSVEEKCGVHANQADQHSTEFLKAVLATIIKETGSSLASVQNGMNEGAMYADRQYPDSAIPPKKACETAGATVRPLHEAWVRNAK